MRPWKSHVVGIVLVAMVAYVFLLLKGPRAAKDLPLEYTALALVPMVAWLILPLPRVLAQAAFGLHRRLWGPRSFYIQLPPSPARTFPRTLLMALGPLALSLLTATQILGLRSAGDPRYLVATPTPFLMVLTGLLTALPPGVWLLDALDLRAVDLHRGVVVPVADPFQRVLGPVGAVALLGSFVTLVHALSDSYAEGLFLVALWTARMFPPILAATTVYRLALEPRVMPRFQGALLAAGKVKARRSLPEALRSAERPTEEPTA